MRGFVSNYSNSALGILECGLNVRCEQGVQGSSSFGEHVVHKVDLSRLFLGVGGRTRSNKALEDQSPASKEDQSRETM